MYIFCLFIKEIYDKIVLLNLWEISLQKKQGKHGSELSERVFFAHRERERDENNLWDMEEWEGELQWQQICLWCSAPESSRHYTKLTALLMSMIVGGGDGEKLPEYEKFLSMLSILKIILLKLRMREC